MNSENELTHPPNSPQENTNSTNETNTIITENKESEINNPSENQINNFSSRKSSSSDLNEDYNFYTRRFSAVNPQPNFKNEKLSFLSNGSPSNSENGGFNSENKNAEKRSSFAQENSKANNNTISLSSNNISNSSSNSNNITNNNINYTNQIISSLKLKIQILANALKDERAKAAESDSLNKNLKTSIEHYEKLLNEKEYMIVNLTKEKYELHTKYDKEKQIYESSNSASSQNLSFSNLLGNIFNRRESSVETNTQNDLEFKKLLNENIDLSHENDLLKKRVDDLTEDFNKCKAEYQNIINSQIEKIKRLESLISEKNFSLDEMQKKLQIMFDNHKKYDVEKTKFESSLNELTKDKKLREEKIIELLLKLEDKENLISSYKESLQRHEIESAELARKLAELKNAIIESSLVITHFQGEKIGTFFNDSVELVFGRTEENEYVMIIKEKGSEEYVDLEDIEYVKISEKHENALDICYVVIKKFCHFIL